MATIRDGSENVQEPAEKWQGYKGWDDPDEGNPYMNGGRDCKFDGIEEWMKDTITPDDCLAYMQ